MEITMVKYVNGLGEYVISPVLAQFVSGRVHCVVKDRIGQPVIIDSDSIEDQWFATVSVD